MAILISGEARSGRSVWELSGSACDPRSSSQIMLLHTREWEMRARSRNAYTVAVIRELVSSPNLFSRFASTLTRAIQYFHRTCNERTVVPRLNLMRLRDHLYVVDFPAALANRERVSCRALHSQRSPAVRASC